ncbi:hypothetical protein Tco_1058705 [Tanacetum coccineum]|uniref:Uncharacterized protein n=1 Tax=Tanacetum coccineum TaxID=301880 RepID=A0ABQ5H916_9ASTR
MSTIQAPVVYPSVRGKKVGVHGGPLFGQGILSSEVPIAIAVDVPLIIVVAICKSIYVDRWMEDTIGRLDWWPPFAETHYRGQYISVYGSSARSSALQTGKESLMIIEKLAYVKTIAQGGYPEAQHYQLLVGQSESNFRFLPCSHGDFLGSILETGIVRDKVRDIVLLGCDASMLLEPAEVMGSEKITLSNESVPANEPDQIRKITRKMTLKEYDKELDEKRKALVSLESEERKVVLDNDLAKMHLKGASTLASFEFLIFVLRVQPAGVKLEHEKIWMLLTNFQVPGPSSIIFALQVKRIVLFI